MHTQKTCHNDDDRSMYKNMSVSIPRGGEGRGRPIEAMLQLARRPSMMGFASATDRRADSGSRKVT